MSSKLPSALSIARSNASLVVEEAKKKAAYAAVEDHITDETVVIGIGSGSTIVYVVERIKQLQLQLNQRQPKREFICIPSSFQAKQLIVENGLRLGELEQYAAVDVCIDGADEV
jgi:ribose 5-phosphate isomerase A